MKVVRIIVAIRMRAAGKFIFSLLIMTSYVPKKPKKMKMIAENNLIVLSGILLHMTTPMMMPMPSAISIPVVEPVSIAAG